MGVMTTITAGLCKLDVFNMLALVTRRGQNHIDTQRINANKGTIDINN